jgi:hypothetical protein
MRVFCNIFNGTETKPELEVYDRSQADSWVEGIGKG